MKPILLIFFLSLISSVASAHTKIVSSVPEAGSTQTTALKQIDLVFDQPFVLATLEITNEAIGFNKRYRFPKPTQMTDHQISIETLPTGNFILEWRGIAKDGHIIRGGFEFSVTN